MLVCMGLCHLQCMGLGQLHFHGSWPCAWGIGVLRASVYGSLPFAQSVWVFANCTIMGLGHVRGGDGVLHAGVYGSWPFAHSVWVKANCTIMGLGHVNGGIRL